MDETDLELRRRTYAFLAERGRAPVAGELGDPDEARRSRDSGPGRARRRDATNPPERAVGTAEKGLSIRSCLVPAARWWDDIVFT